MATWETIVHEHGPMVWQTAYRLLGNRSDADECMQEAFVAAVAIWRRGPIQNWPGLLRKLAVLRGVDCLRRRAREAPRQEGEVLLSTAVSPDASPAAAAEKQESILQLRHALCQLPPHHAEVVCLRYLNEMSYEEISKELGISVSHVGVILSRAREELRNLLEERGADHG